MIRMFSTVHERTYNGTELLPSSGIQLAPYIIYATSTWKLSNDHFERQDTIRLLS